MLIKGARRQSRQSQTWVRLPDVGWRIVAAHVSAPLVLPAGRLAMGRLCRRRVEPLGFTLEPAHRAGVVANLERTAAIAAPFLAFPLPDEADPAPVFTA